uniref:Uncharacterized protein n=1 Tax=Bos mutus grunniens TaxID=30521 RepID=A0A8B9YRY5_BOSMU
RGCAKDADLLTGSGDPKEEEEAGEDCPEELFNFLHGDHCMTHKLVNSLK